MRLPPTIDNQIKPHEILEVAPDSSDDIVRVSARWKSVVVHTDSDDPDVAEYKRIQKAKGVMPMTDEDKLERLEAIARERWGKRWTITQKHFADGTTKVKAWRNLAPVDIDDVEGKVFEREEIRIKDGEALHSHVYRHSGGVVETVEYETTDIDETEDLESLE